MRKLINLFETVTPNDDSVRLYRGDSTKIEAFDTGETNLYSLFGHGIYLTDNVRVANDYRTKGNDAGDVIYRLADAKSKQDVIDRYIRRIAAKMDAQGNDLGGDPRYWTRPVPFSDGGDWGSLTNDLRKQEAAVRMAFAAEKWKELSREYEVRIKLDRTGVIVKKKAGAMAVFEVPSAVVKKTLDAEAKMPSAVLDELLYLLDRNGDRSTARDISQYIRDEDGDVSFRAIFTNITADSPIRGDREVLDAFLEHLQDLGYAGISYLGGVSMGGGYKHRAYVFWDGDAVNRYRVS